MAWKLQQAVKKMAPVTAVAMPNGGWPICDHYDLVKAIERYFFLFQVDDVDDAVKQHIVNRAYALSLQTLLPDDWQKTSPEEQHAQESKLQADLLLLREHLSSPPEASGTAGA